MIYIIMLYLFRYQQNGIKRVKNTIIISLKKSEFKVCLEKLLFIISRLSGKNIRYKNKNELMILMEKYRLLNYSFLKDISE